MKKELKQAIVKFVFDNENDHQLVNNTVKEFSDYIYSKSGNYLIGGKEVRDFIVNIIKYLVD